MSSEPIIPSCDHQHVPTDETRATVTALISYGIVQEEIGRYIGIDAKTLRKWYRTELDTGSVIANAKVGKFIHRVATGEALGDGAMHSDCVRAAIYWTKTRMGWRESQDINHTSSDGSMSPNRIVIEAAGLDDHSED